MKLGLIGVGLIGGSLARAARAAGHVSAVVGYDTDASALSKALELGAITTAARSAEAAAIDADMVVLAVPVGAMRGVLQAIAPQLSRTAW